MAKVKLTLLLVTRNNTIEREGAVTMIDPIGVHRMFILIRF